MIIAFELVLEKRNMEVYNGAGASDTIWARQERGQERSEQEGGRERERETRRRREG